MRLKDLKKSWKIWKGVAQSWEIVWEIWKDGMKKSVWGDLSDMSDASSDTSVASSDFSDNSSDFWLIIIKVFQPFDMRLKKFLDEKNKQIEQLIFVEMNYSGQMEERVTNKCRLHDKKREGKVSHYRKYTLYPIFLEEIDNW